MRSIPDLKLISPADGLGVASLIWMFETESPAYIRLTGGTNNPVIYPEDRTFDIGQAIELETGTDLTIFATGSMVFQSLRAAEELAKHGVSVLCGICIPSSLSIRML